MPARRVLTSLALVAAGALITGCAQGTSDNSSSNATFNPDAKLSGKLTVMGFGATDEIGQVRLDEAKKALGDVKVKTIEGDLDIQQFLSSVASGQPPEIIYANRDQIGTFASRGAIMPLSDCIKGEGIDTSVFNQSALDQVTFDGTVYGVPEFNVVQIIQANADLLRKAGVTLDDVNGSDWTALAAANKKLMRSSGGKVSVIGF